MAKGFDELVSKLNLSPERRERIERRTQELLAEVVGERARPFLMEVDERYPDALTIEPRELDAMLESPEFDMAGKCHDWRNHVPGLVRELWGELPVEARFVAWYMGKIQADREEWD
jgi:hypothetical protein